jgi:crotonobetainyl-CoA:carnitine CoA-transferase CaiB-like acyl-CoA transferase
MLLTLPLDGISVVQAGDGIGASYAGKLLRDLGCEVWKHESAEPAASTPPPVAAYQKVLREFLDRGKRFFPKPEAADRARSADIVITASSLPEIARVGIDPGMLASTGGIVVSLTSFGLRESPDGPMIPDLLASALGGFILLTGLPDHPPTRNQASLPQFQAALGGVIGALAALLAKEAGGGGDVVDVSLYESAAYLMEREDVVFTHQHTLWTRTARHKVVHPFAIFPCADGYVGLAVAGATSFSAMADLIEQPRLGEDQRILLSTIDYADLIDTYLLPWLAARDKRTICALFQERRIPATPVLDFLEIVADAQLRDREFFRTADLSGDERIVPGPPYRISE